MITVEWGNTDHDLVVWKFTTPWTFEEFSRAQQVMYDMVAETNGKVDAIFLTSTEQQIPQGAISYLRKVIFKYHPQLNYVIVVGAQTYLLSLLHSLSEMIPGLHHHLMQARSLHEALHLIEKLREQRKHPTL